MGEGPRGEYVLLSLYSFKAESAPLTEELSKYGEVQGILFREWIQLDDVMDGARVVCMTHSGRVPRLLHINDHIGEAWYRGMPITCDTYEESHKAKNCLLKGSVCVAV